MGKYKHTITPCFYVARCYSSGRLDNFRRFEKVSYARKLQRTLKGNSQYKYIVLDGARVIDNVTGQVVHEFTPLVHVPGEQFYKKEKVNWLTEVDGIDVTTPTGQPIGAIASHAAPNPKQHTPSKNREQ